MMAVIEFLKVEHIIVGGATMIAWFTYCHARSQAELAALSPKLDELVAKGIVATAERFAKMDPWLPLISANIRDEALAFLLEIERCAQRDSCLKHWHACLLYNDVFVLKSALQRLWPLVQLVQETELPLERHVWNGVRKHAFRMTYRLFRSEMRVAR